MAFLPLTSTDILVVTSVAGLFVLWRLYRFFRCVYATPLRVLPSPPVPSFLYGNLKEHREVDNNVLADKWFAQYGKHFVDHALFMVPRLWTLDPRAIHHVLTNFSDYPRTEENRRLFASIAGGGLIIVTGDAHRKQRRIMNPAFGPAQVRDLTEIFLRKSMRLRDVWSRAVSQSGPIRVNVNRDLSRLTLDIIGLAGFNYDFRALDDDGKPNELSTAFRKFFASTRSNSFVFTYLSAWIPFLRRIPTKRAKDMQSAMEVIWRVGTKLVRDKQAEVARAAAEKHVNGIERKDLRSRDLLTLLIKANMATDVPDDQKLTDEEVLNQIPTFLIAGHETTSTATTWALYELSVNPTVQQKLREELLAVPTEDPTMEELNALPYLGKFLREVLRLHAPVAHLLREAQKDDVIPVSEPFTGRDGKVHYEIRIAKGNQVFIPILALHRSKEIWGEDALEFKPERWEQPPEVISSVPGVWGHLLTFIGGPRACIGYRFSLVETKAIIFTLLRAFEFELAVPREDITVASLPLQRPSVLSEPKEGYQLPLLVRPYKAA